jgi:hypothetical protein
VKKEAKCPILLAVAEEEQRSGGQRRQNMGGYYLPVVRAAVHGEAHEEVEMVLLRQHQRPWLLDAAVQVVDDRFGRVGENLRSFSAPARWRVAEPGADGQPRSLAFPPQRVRHETVGISGEINRERQPGE